MKVCIAEKPSVAKEIAYIIGAKSRKDGYFEGNGYAVTWTFGHLCTLKLPDDYQSEWKKWRMDALPIIPEKFEVKLIKNKGVKKQFGIIKKLFKQAEIVINCGDAGQEGELIQRWVMQEAKYKGAVQRLWISSLTPEAIKDGFRNLKPASQFDNLFYAGSSRAIGDWLLGMNATRLYTLKYGGYKQVLSIGRVQTPTLAMLVERFKEIRDFVPKPYWELQTLYRKTTFNYIKGRFEKKEAGEKLLQQVENHPFTIKKVDKKNGREQPPRLFDLTSLQVHCNKRFGFSADQTLKLVQKLYEQKLVTYPRVDTTYLPDDVYPKVAGILGKLTNYSQFTQPLLGKTIRKSKKVFNNKKVTDHHAIIPTGFFKTLAANEQKVYDAMTRRFRAAFYPDCEVAKTTVIGEANDVQFKANGKEILKEGWRVLFPKTTNNKNQNTREKTAKQKEEEERILPEFKVGESGAHQPSLVEKMTQPPKQYTEATLLRAMETAGKKVDNEELRDLMKANGIGRPSTRANIIETLFRRNYAERKKKSIIATDIGVQLIETIDNQLLKSAELTGQWEKHLGDISKGNYRAQQFITDMKTLVGDLVREVKNAKPKPKFQSTVSSVAAGKSKAKGKRGSKNAKLTQPLYKGKKETSLTETKCPKCRKGTLLKGKAAYGCSEWKTGCSFRLPFQFQSKKISEKQLARLLKMGATITLKGFKEGEQKVNGKLRFSPNFEVFLDKEIAKKNFPKTSKKTATAKPKSDSISCPKCGIGKVIKGKTAYGCTLWQTGCSWRFSFDKVRQIAAEKPLTKELVTKILRGH